MLLKAVVSSTLARKKFFKTSGHNCVYVLLMTPGNTRNMTSGVIVRDHVENEAQ